MGILQATAMQNSRDISGENYGEGGGREGGERESDRRRGTAKAQLLAQKLLGPTTY
jgi:hypothetical protein